MERTPGGILTYRDVFLNTRSLVEEADLIHYGGGVDVVNMLSKYAPHVLRQRELEEQERKKNGAKTLPAGENDTQIHRREVLDVIGRIYQDRLMMHLQNGALKPEGVFSKDIIRGLVENSTLRKWGNRVQFDELKSIVDAIAEHDGKGKEKED